MKYFVHNVLGTPYEVKLGTREELNMSEENMGECKIYAKEILVCTEKGDCNEKELELRVSEILAHEIFHAYCNEAGVDLSVEAEEMLATFFMKNWRKMNDSILDAIARSGFDRV